VLSRVADAIFWMGRYVERAVAASRLADATLHLQLDDPALHNGAPPTNPEAVISSIHRAREAARGVRDSLSTEMWEQLNTLHLWLADSEIAKQAEDDPVAFFREVRQGAQFFQGLVDSTMMRGEDWQFARMGMYLERADNVARALHLLGHLLEVTPDGHGDEAVRWLAVLRSCGSAEAFARYYSLRVEPARVVEFVLLNPVYPQSVRFSLASAYEAACALASSGGDPVVRSLGRLWATLEYAAVDELIQAGLRPFLEDILKRIADVSDHVTALYLADLPVRGEPNAAERAAILMAVQQQQ
jgi:uncharacterized alpha-E superfamily protein